MTAHDGDRTPPPPAQVGTVLGVLAATVVLAAWCAHAGAPPSSAAASGQAGSDVAMYAAVRAKLAEGASFYPTLREGLSSGGFALRPVFNWRFPAHLELLASLPWPVGAQRLFRLLAVLAGASMLQGSNRVRAGATAFLVLLQFWAFSGPSAMLLSEPWSAVLLTVSAAGLLWDVPALRVLGGVGALCMRELAAPWCVGLTIWALWTGRRREALAWMGLGGLYLAAWGVHAQHVLDILPPNAVQKSWLGLGGLPQVLRTLHWYFPVQLGASLAPWAIGAVALAIVAPPADAPRIRVVAVMVAAYLLFFAVLGNPNNDYWGAMIAGLLHPVVIGGLTGAAQVLWRARGASQAVHPTT